MNQSNSDKKDLEYKVYLEERKSLIESKFEEARLFDKAILTLAAGALGLSLTFVRQIAPQPDSWTKPILAASWGSFSLSLLCTLISFLTSQYACSKQIEILEGNNSETDANSKEEHTVHNRWGACTRKLNWASIVSFIIGAILLSIFGIANLP